MTYASITILNLEYADLAGSSSTAILNLEAVKHQVHQTNMSTCPASSSHCPTKHPANAANLLCPSSGPVSNPGAGAGEASLDSRNDHPSKRQYDTETPKA